MDPTLCMFNFGTTLSKKKISKYEIFHNSCVTDKQAQKLLSDIVVELVSWVVTKNTI